MAVAQTVTGTLVGRVSDTGKVSGVVPRLPSATVASATDSPARLWKRATWGSWSLEPIEPFVSSAAAQPALMCAARIWTRSSCSAWLTNSWSSVCAEPSKT